MYKQVTTMSVLILFMASSVLGSFLTEAKSLSAELGTQGRNGWFNWCHGITPCNDIGFSQYNCYWCGCKWDTMPTGYDYNVFHYCKDTPDAESTFDRRWDCWEGHCDCAAHFGKARTTDGRPFNDPKKTRTCPKETPTCYDHIPHVKYGYCY